MIRLLLKKLIYMEGGYMLNNIMLPLIVGFIGLFGIMLSFYILLCFIQWMADVIEEKRWLVWMEWFRYDN